MLDIDVLRTRIREAGNVQRIAREAGVARNTIYGFIDETDPKTPQRDTLLKLEAWLEGSAHHPPEYWRGVYYATEVMAASLAQLLREARESGTPRDHRHHPEAKAVSRSATPAAAPEARARRQK